MTGSGPKPEENASMTFQSTCNQALELCNNNFECRSALKPVLQFCNITKCKRQNCMEALQTLYRTVDLTWSLEIAFCLCKSKTLYRAVDLTWSPETASFGHFPVSTRYLESTSLCIADILCLQSSCRSATPISHAPVKTKPDYTVLTHHNVVQILYVRTSGKYTYTHTIL
ncbi:hypothetical protein J6590_058897 [Homalodisca vitripennis]|nr:hypothetical protein J6590_058897 [Homalodisca vitripennis]